MAYAKFIAFTPRGPTPGSENAGSCAKCGANISIRRDTSITAHRIDGERAEVRVPIVVYCLNANCGEIRAIQCAATEERVMSCGSYYVTVVCDGPEDPLLRKAAHRRTLIPEEEPRRLIERPPLIINTS